MNENEEKVTPFKVWDDQTLINKILEIDLEYPSSFTRDEMQDILLQKYKTIIGLVKQAKQSALTRASEAKPTASDVGGWETVEEAAERNYPYFDGKVSAPTIRNNITRVDNLREGYIKGRSESASLIAAKDKQIAELTEQLKNK